MNLRRQPLMPPQGLDIAPMPPASPMQFGQPATPDSGGGPSGFDMLAQVAQQYRTGVLARQDAQANAVQSAETDAPIQRRKPPFAAAMDTAATYA